MPAVALVILLSSCSSLVPFTQQLRDNYKLKPEELKSIQFYFSNTVVLRRGENSDKRETSNGELTVVKNSKVEEIIIKAGTPCIIKEVIDGDRVTISFEENGNNYLVFGSVNNRDGFYTLMARDWRKGKGEINYGEKIYYSSPGSKDVFLALKVKSLEKFKVEQKIAKGALIK